MAGGPLSRIQPVPSSIPVLGLLARGAAGILLALTASVVILVRLLRLSVIMMIACVAGMASVVAAQNIDLTDATDRPIADIRLDGLHRVSRQLVMNQIRSAVGAPLDIDTVRSDVRTLTRLGEFASIDASVELLEDGSVRLIYKLNEQPVIAEVQVVGNRQLTDQELLALVPFTPGAPRDNFAIQNSVRSIENLYRSKGFFLTNVEVDESRLEESGILVLRIIEGPRVRIKAIEFEGNQAFPTKQLRSQISTTTWTLLFNVGELSEEKLLDDVGKLVTFYKDRGYLDVRVDRRIELSPDNREAKVVFLIVEGSPFIVRSIRTQRRGGQPLRVMHPLQVAAQIELKPGDIYRRDKLRKSVESIRASYGQMGYFALTEAGERGWLVDVQPYENRVGEEKLVDLVMEIDEGKRYMVGTVNIAGNFLTKDKVIRREVRLDPGRPFDATQIRASQERIQRTQLFNEVRITVLEPEESAEAAASGADETIKPPGDHEIIEGEPPKFDHLAAAAIDAEIDARYAQYRDVLIEVKERNTGSFNFGAAIGSDTGLFGEVSLRQENFDIADVPESFGEWISGRAFRGAGQKFAITIAPGVELSRYSISLTEPHFLDTNYSLGGSSTFFQREYDDYDEERLSFNTRVGRRFGEVWDGAVTGRFERVELYDISSTAPTAVFDDAGPNNLTGLGLAVNRTTVVPGSRPGRGSRLELAIEQVGAFGGDRTFTKLSQDYTVFLTIDEDFLGRKSILKLNNRIAYIINGDEAPVYERYYLGGRSFRGFEFRTISPKGVQRDGQPSNEPIGGAWMFFLGAQYEFPLWERFLTGVVFADTGTVTNDISFDDYRVSVGAGIRLYVPMLGPNPIAVDFGFPILKLDTDEEQLVSFSADVPF